MTFLLILALLFSLTLSILVMKGAPPTRGGGSIGRHPPSARSDAAGERDRGGAQPPGQRSLRPIDRAEEHPEEASLCSYHVRGEVGGGVRKTHRRRHSRAKLGRHLACS